MADYTGDENDIDAVMDWLYATDIANQPPPADERARKFDEGWTKFEKLAERGMALANEFATARTTPPP